MARARLRRNRQQREIAEVVIAEWLRVLPPHPDGSSDILEMDPNSLTAAFSELLDRPCEAIVDGANIVKIVVPRPPVETKAELEKYFEDNRDFIAGFSAAALFGCGR